MKNINLHLDLIAGLPGEDFKSLAAGFDEVLRLQARHLQLGFLKVLPGTQMADLAAEYGIIYENSAPYEVLQTSELSCQELATVREIEELLENYYNSGKYRITLAGLLEQEISGWEFFVKLAGHYKKADVDIHLRKWDKCARILYDHLRLQNLMPAAELLDRLRLDWCQQAKSHYYLDWLDSREMRSAKENGYQLLRKQKKLNNVLLSAAQMRQAIFWTAESSLAAKNEIWVFYGAAAHKNKLVLKQD
jgi:hypothetical protein